MNLWKKSAFVFCVLFSVYPCASGGGAADPLLEKAIQIFGQPLDPERKIFGLPGQWVIWLIEDNDGKLIEADAGPASYYFKESPEIAKRADEEGLSVEQYEEMIRKISTLKPLGRLRQAHGPAETGIVGRMNTDGFEDGFVERIVAPDNETVVKKFDVYFLMTKSASPEEIADSSPPRMVCLGSGWYYLSFEQSREISLGKWQKLEIAGPSMRRSVGCARTTPVYDAQGFNVEQPQNETVLLSEPFKVRKLSGQVHDPANGPVEAAHVEFLRTGTRRVLRSMTDANGHFSLPNRPEGRYEFKITKDGFKALRGEVIVDRNASGEARLTFELHVGT